MPQYIENTIQQAVSDALKDLFDVEVPAQEIGLNETRPDFEGDVTVVVFPLLRYTRRSPEESGRMIGSYLQERVREIDRFNVVKGFLNCVLSQDYWQDVFRELYLAPSSPDKVDGKVVMVEFSSPNTNKPLHLGHIRNIVLGDAVSGLLSATGNNVIRANLVNDRGIHICKSMLAWSKWGNGETPESTGIKGDHLVGKYYVVFDQHYKAEIAALVAEGMDGAAARESAASIVEAREMLRKWEAGDEEVTALWRKMNSWVYAGFDVTYRDLGVSFDQYYYESDTYLLGKEIVLRGLEAGVFYRKEDGSVWVNLEKEGLDEKILLRSDGTSVYITQDIGTADLKYSDHRVDRSIYVVGNEQDYHFKVLKLICQKLGKPYADGIHHLSYGMVELPSGKMKSREGTVVDADDLIGEMVAAARERTEELGKIEGFTPEEAEHLYRVIALGALKFYLLKVDPRKNMLFNPEESIDLHGHTGPFVQYAHARIRSVLRRSGWTAPEEAPTVEWHPLERELIRQLARSAKVLEEAGAAMNPASLVDYAYHLARLYNKYYAEVTILGADSEALKQFRLMLSDWTARTIRDAFGTVGIEVPDRM